MSSPSTTRNLYSLNDRSFLVDMGMFRNWTINPCPAGAPWGVNVIEDRLVSVDLGDDKREVRTVTATEFVNDIVVRYSGEGVFLADEDDSPTAEEVEKARKEFELTDLARITAAQGIWDVTHNRSKIGQQARDAARRRHQVVEWAQNALVEQKNCQFCGEIVRASAIKCKHCAEFLDGRNQRSAPVAAPVEDTTDDTAAKVHALIAGKKR